MAVFQVYFTAGFPEEGKGSLEGYSIYYYARASARVWFVQKWAGKVKIPAGWSEKYLWKDGILYRMTRKKSENTPREKEKMFVRTENSFRKMRIFPLKSPGKSTKMMKTGRKISFPAREKTWKLSRRQGKNVWNWVMESEKSGFFFWKNSGEA